MDEWTRPFRISRLNLRRWPANPRYAVILLLLIILTHYMISPVSAFAQAVRYRACPWILPFFVSHPYVSMLLLFGAILLFCDAPFMNNHTPYECIRSGRTVWLCGQFIYILSAALIYTLVITALTVVWLLPNMTILPEWGKVISTLARTDARIQYKVSFFNDLILQAYTPLPAMIYSMLLLWLQACFIGALMFVTNLFAASGRGIGGILATFHVMTAGLATMIGGSTIANFVPSLWLNLVVLDTSGRSLNPQLHTAIIILVLLIGACAVLAFRAMRNRTLDVYPEV